MRDTMDCYQLFHKHQQAFDDSATLTEFTDKTKLSYVSAYVGGWVEQAFMTMKAGKETYRGLRLPNANKFSDLFTHAYLVETHQHNKPAGSKFLGGSAGFCRHLGGTRGYSKTIPDIKSHYGAKFYGTYVVPIENINFKDTSFEAITRTDGILITVNSIYYVGCDWVALLDLTEDIRTMLDEETTAFLAKERQAEIDAWGETRL